MPTAPQPKYQGSFCNLGSAYFLAGALVTAASPTRLKGKGFTVSKTSTGVFRVTFNTKFPKVITAVGTLRQAAGAANFLKGPVTVDANNYVEFRVENASGAAADPGTSDVIDFFIVLATNTLSVA
jgi:hypothetical protein